jgi:7-carboxy-7-deazaguanine synthase
MANANTLRITEVFYSLQGEAKTVGIPTVFVRLTGCPLRCQYCDTDYAFEGGKIIELDDLGRDIEQFNCKYITVTGGEPLAQPNCGKLLERLCVKGYTVSLETGGAMSINGLDKRVSIVMDLKTPGSLECEKNNYDNISLLQMKDQIKFVICDRDDYEWSKSKLMQYDLAGRVGEVLFSPSYEQVDNAELAKWILDDHLPVRMQLQMHKQIWGNESGR